MKTSNDINKGTMMTESDTTAQPQAEVPKPCVNRPEVGLVIHHYSIDQSKWKYCPTCGASLLPEVLK